MGPGIVSFMFAVGASTWIFNRFQRTTGNDTKRSLTAAGLSGLALFIMVFIILKLVGF